MISINKKLKILISSVLISISFISLPFQHRDVKAIVGVDDAILFGIASVLLGIGTASAVGLTGKSCEGYFCNSGIDSILQPFENLKDTYDTTQSFVALPTTIGTFLKHFSDDYKSKLGQSYSYSFTPSNVLEYNGKSYYVLDIPKSNSKIKLFSLTFEQRALCYVFKDSSLVTPIDSFPVGTTVFYSSLVDGWYELIFTGGFSSTCNLVHSSDTSVYDFSIYVPITSFRKGVKEDTFKSLSTDLSNPSTINLNKDKTEAIALDYVNKYPEQNKDNDGDGKPDLDYSTLIPFIFDMLNEDLGNGEITPQALADNNLLTYTFEDGSVIGSNPYSSLVPSDSNVTVNNSIVVNNGSDVSEEEKNGILNLLDNGLRSTTERLKSLNVALGGFKDNISSLFSFLPDDVTNLIFLGICLTVVFFILGLRR